jgi:hypothetical protein
MYAARRRLSSLWYAPALAALCLLLLAGCGLPLPFPQPTPDHKLPDSQQVFRHWSQERTPAISIPSIRRSSSSGPTMT